MKHKAFPPMFLPATFFCLIVWAIVAYACS